VSRRRSRAWTVTAVSAAAVLLPGTAQAAISVGVPVLVSRSAAGAIGNADSAGAVISDDGNLVVFGSRATNLLPNPTGASNFAKLFVKNVRTGRVQLVSRKSTGAASAGNLSTPDVSGDGLRVVFVAPRAALVPQDLNNRGDVYLRDLATDTTSLVSVAAGGGPSEGGTGFGAISGNGRFVALSSSARDLVAGDTNGATDAFVRDLVTGSTERISVRPDGSQTKGFSAATAISADGRYVVFLSSATDLVPGLDADAGADDAFVRDRVTGTTSWVSRAAGAGPVLFAAISPDGRFVAQRLDLSGELLVTEVATGATQNLGAASISQHPFTSDGRFIAYAVDNARAELRDLVTGQVRLLSRRAAGGAATGSVTEPVLTPNGHFAALATDAADVVAADTNAAFDVFRMPLRLS
jgi:Tol biopolymer transport system component